MEPNEILAIIGVSLLVGFGVIIICDTIMVRRIEKLRDKYEELTRGQMKVLADRVNHRVDAFADAAESRLVDMLKQMVESADRRTDEQLVSISKSLATSRGIIDEIREAGWISSGDMSAAKAVAREALALAVAANSGVEAINKSTHRVQYVPAEQMAKMQLPSQVEGNDVEDVTMDMRRFEELVSRAADGNQPPMSDI